MNRKEMLFVVVLIIIFFAALLFVKSVSAQSFSIGQGSRDLVRFLSDWAAPFLQAILGGTDSGMLLFEKLLIFVLLLCLIYLSLKNLSLFENQSTILWVVTIIVPVLAVRFLNINWVNTIIFQYELLGIVIAGVFPFIIYFFFLNNVSPDNSIVRKVGWIFFIVVYFLLWTNNSLGPSYSEIYFWTMVAAGVFFVLDGTIHNIFEKRKWNDSMKSSIYDEIGKIDEQIARLRNSTLPNSVKNREIKNLEKQRNSLIKHMNKL